MALRKDIMSNIARRNATLSTKKRAVLQRRKAGSHAFKSFPLSPAQQRLWLLDQFEPGNPSFNIATSWYMHGLLDVRVLAQSLNSIIQRHEILRATFAATQDQPVQIIASQLTLTIQVIDLTALLSGAEQEVEAQRQIEPPFFSPGTGATDPCYAASVEPNGAYPAGHAAPYHCRWLVGGGIRAGTRYPVRIVSRR
jgi:hypothetical protein